MDVYEKYGFDNDKYEMPPIDVSPDAFIVLYDVFYLIDDTKDVGGGVVFQADDLETVLDKAKELYGFTG
jgi:hypothetical protein